MMASLDSEPVHGVIVKYFSKQVNGVIDSFWYVIYHMLSCLILRFCVKPVS